MIASLVIAGIDALIYTFAAVAIAGPIALFVAILRA